jgi:hypothetical protein
MYRVYLKRQDEYVIALILGPNASEGEVEKWAKEAPFDGPSQKTSMSAALEYARERRPALWNIRDPGRLGELNCADIDRMINPK